MKYKNWLIAFAIVLLTIPKFFSQTENVDSLFQEARSLAFASQYAKSIALCKKILTTAPNYQDAQVLMGRAYFWNNNPDSAIFILNQTLNSAHYADAYVALSDIQRFTSKPSEALTTAESGLSFFSDNEDLQIRKVKALIDLKADSSAFSFADSIVHINGNPELRQLLEKMKRLKSKNVITVSYDFDYFDKQFTEPWHLISVGYGRRTRHLGMLTLRANLANRYNSNGSQIEMDAYPTFGKKMYAYLNAGYSDDFTFPNYRAGLSVYRNFKHAFEGELGVRFLYFSKTTILYVGSIGKYQGNFWFSFRPTFIASSNGNEFSQSYSLITRYYLKTAFDYVTLTLGYGLSPDDRSRETLLQNADFKSYKANLAVQKLIKGNNILSVSAGIVNLEYFQGIKSIGNNYYTGLIYQKMF
ncbi:MAG: YaiO family outer membrane beta-barrel protein [Bacteroidota bacterium]